MTRGSKKLAALAAAKTGDAVTAALTTPAAPPSADAPPAGDPQPPAKTDPDPDPEIEQKADPDAKADADVTVQDPAPEIVEEPAPAAPKRYRVDGISGSILSGDKVPVSVNGRLIHVTVGADAEIPAEHAEALRDAGLTIEEF